MTSLPRLPQENTPPPFSQIAAAKLIERRAASRVESFHQFVGRVSRRYIWYRHCEIIAAAAERVAAGEIARLMIFVPPRHSKSETISRLFTAYYLRKHPDKWVGLTSYSADLAYVLSRASQDNYLAAGGTLNDKAGAVKHWETGKGGGLWAAGVGGPITGKGYDLGCIDDPLKNAEEAASEIIRAKQKEWYSSTFYTRAEPGAAIIIIQCMTGDTPVLMFDGAERPLRDVRAGDYVATYHFGQLRAAKVLRHGNGHHDFIFKIIMTSGRIVRANARHPFLVDDHGELKWTQLQNLTTGQKIVTVKGSGESGRGRSAWLKNATNPPSAEDTATAIITKRSGQMVIAPLPLTRTPIAADTSSIAMASRLTSTMQCLRLKTADARSASNYQGPTSALIGAANYALIIATKQIQFGRSCVTTATLPWDTPKPKPQPSPWRNTSDFTTDQIESIEPAGIEEVFDLQVEGTENFIANGLVSHNTRWHEDDLSGWLLDQESESPEYWHIVNLPALAEDPANFPATCTVESDWRASGEALCPERYDAGRLQAIQARIGGYFFDALYQQRPSAREGEFFKVNHLEIEDAPPAGLRICRAWDLAASSGGGDYTAGVKIGAASDGKFYIVDVRRGQWSPDERDAVMRQAAQMDTNAVKIRLAQDPGQAGVDQAQRLTRMLAGYNVRSERVTGDKPTRAAGFAAQVNAGNVRLIRGQWNESFLEELRQFPQGRNDDQVDAAADAFNELTLGSQYAQGKLLR